MRDREPHTHFRQRKNNLKHVKHDVWTHFFCIEFQVEMIISLELCVEQEYVSTWNDSKSTSINLHGQCILQLLLLNIEVKRISKCLV